MIMEEPTDDPRPPDAYRYLVEESRADGLLVATALRVPEHAGGLPAVPHVYVNRRGPKRGNDVVMDESGAVRLFLDHVTGLGHRSIAIIDGPPEVDTVHRRVSAARRMRWSNGLWPGGPNGSTPNALMSSDLRPKRRLMTSSAHILRMSWPEKSQINGHYMARLRHARQTLHYKA
jgi:hypothetical protein